MDIKAGLVKRSRGDPWHLNQTSGKVIGITVIIYVCGEKIQVRVVLLFHALLMRSKRCWDEVMRILRKLKVKTLGNIYIYVHICCYRGKKQRLYFHPYKPVSWLLTHQGILLLRIFVTSLQNFLACKWHQCTLNLSHDQGFVKEVNNCMKTNLSKVT